MATIPSLALIPSGYKASKVYSVLPTNGTGDFTFTRSGNATRVNSEGLIELVSTNVPRLNYPLIDGVVQGCPSLLLEPSRTNLVTFSEQFDNAAWVKSFSILTSNAATSPDGYTNADKLIATSVLDGHIVRQPATLTDSTNYSLSVFAKAAEYDFCRLQPTTKDGTSNNTFFNLVTGVVASTGVGHTATIEDFSNGWYRCTIVYNAGTGATTTNQQRIGVSQDGINQSFLGNDSSGIYIWGAMLEAGSYPTSYIPSLTGSQTTRSAETCNNAGDASTFNDSEGVLMAEIKWLDESGAYRGISVSDGLSNDNNRIQINFNQNTGNLVLNVTVGGVHQALYSSTIFPSNFLKVGIKYKENDFAFWVNGIEIYTDNLGITYPANTLSELKFNSPLGAVPFYGNTKQIQYFNTALNDSDLETLTSWDSFSDMATGQLYTIE
jgi:hypothetical protein